MVFLFVWPGRGAGYGKGVSKVAWGGRLGGAMVGWVKEVAGWVGVRGGEASGRTAGQMQYCRAF